MVPANMEQGQGPAERSGRRAASRGPSDYLAYFGRYEADTENQLVRHFLEAQIHPGRHPNTLERKYRFYDDKLLLRPVEGMDREILSRGTATERKQARSEIAWPAAGCPSSHPVRSAGRVCRWPGHALAAAWHSDGPSAKLNARSESIEMVPGRLT